MKKSKYKLVTEYGHYESDNLFLLFVEILSHRIYHLLKDGEWRD